MPFKQKSIDQIDHYKMIWNFMWKIWNLKFNQGKLEKGGFWKGLDLQEIKIHHKGRINKVAGEFFKERQISIWNKSQEIVSNG